jgi:hypothetical protein
MVTYMKIAGVFTYFYAGVYALGSVFFLFGSLFQSDGSLFLAFLIFSPITWLLIKFADAHFRMARRTQNYINFCKAVDLDDDKEHSEKFFRQFKLEVK